MTLRGLKGQPRNVIAKFKGFSPAEKQEVFDSLTPEKYAAHGRHLYWIAESRPRTAEIGEAGSAAVKIVVDKMRQAATERFM